MDVLWLRGAERVAVLPRPAPPLTWNTATSSARRWACSRRFSAAVVLSPTSAPFCCVIWSSCVTATFMAVLELCRNNLIKLAGAASDCTVTAEGDAPEELM